jgi:DNA (cytosine-5)-methyltransferase 1
VAIDLFAGAGGLSLGFEMAGFDVVAAVEYDPIHSAIHQLNFPTATVICENVRTLSGADIRSMAGLGRGVIDVVIGGPPCQGFSLIGQRVLNDARNELVFHFLRLVDELRPKMFVMENVPGMATGKHHRLLDELMQGFGEIGYRVRAPFQTLNAAHFGVPQDRRRLFLLGAREGQPIPQYPRPVTAKRFVNGKRPSTKEQHLLERLPLGPSVADAIGDLPEIERFDELLSSDVLSVRLNGGTKYAMRRRGELPEPDDYSYKRARMAETLSGCLRAAHSPKSRRRFAKTAPGETEPVSRFFRLPPDGLSNTLRAGTATDRGAFSAPRPIHPTSPRCISVREAARLHSFPDWFRFHRTIWHGFRQIGNAVPPLLGRAVGSEIMAALKIEPTLPDEVLAQGDEALATMSMKEAARHFGVSHAVIAPRRRFSAGKKRSSGRSLARR